MKQLIQAGLNAGLCPSVILAELTSFAESQNLQTRNSNIDFFVSKSINRGFFTDSVKIRAFAVDYNAQLWYENGQKICRKNIYK